jgi:hypothetical protein
VAVTMPADEPPPAAVAGVRRRRISPWVIPVVVSAVIALWQLDFNTDLRAPVDEDTLRASAGLLPDIRYFFYFYYHFGLFPVGAKEAPHLGPSRQNALDFVARHGSKLRMDFSETNNMTRFGDYGKLWMLWPDAVFKRDPTHPSAKPFNEILFITGLLAVWWAFWREKRVLLGSLIVLLVGSDPFQLYETYGHANVFSLPISVAIIVLAAHARFLSGRVGLGRGAWLTALVSGVALATVRELRTEAVLIAAALVPTYLLLRGPWPRRVALVLVFLAAWGVTGRAWTSYWSRGFERSTEFVARAGGEVYKGPHSFNHALWHAVYCGLADYGSDRGFTWEDRDAFRWAVTYDAATNPHPLPYHYREGYYFEETYDGIHHIAPTDLTAYNQLVRARVLGVIRARPLWYARILVKRVGAILGEATAATLSLGVVQWRLPGVGWLLVPILLLLLFQRRWFEFKLALFTLPLSAVALMVYSGRGMTGYGIAHLIALAVGIDLAIRAWQTRTRKRSLHVV